MKDRSILDVIARLRERLGHATFEVTDHWVSDPFATGVSQPGVPGQLVYISTFNRLPGHYEVTLEAPPRISDELPFESKSDWLEVDFEMLVDTVAQHLHVERWPPAG